MTDARDRTLTDEQLDRLGEHDLFRHYLEVNGRLNELRTKRRNIQIFCGLGIGAGVSVLVGGEMSTDAGLLIIGAALAGLVWSLGDNPRILRLSHEVADINARYQRERQQHKTPNPS
tara:strand:- start:524 stop:874 length:351 start_codon:yes stop_codon:yes gene_type:complete